MIGDWSQAVRREYTGGNARFDFPSRPLGKAKVFALFLVVFGIGFMWMPAHVAWDSIQKLRQGHADAGTIIFSFFPLLFVIAGCVPMFIGLAIMFGRTRVEWRDGGLRVAERVGPLFWTRRLPRKPVRTLEVSAGTVRRGDAPPTPMDNFASLGIVYEDGTRSVVALGYPKDWLLPVAEELKTFVGSTSVSAEAPRVEVVNAAPVREEDADANIPQPAGCRVQLEERGAGIRLTVPPAGLWKGSGGLILFALLWCGFMTVFTVVFFLPGTKREVSVGVFLLIIGGFWLVGLSLLAAAVNMGRRRAELTVDGGRLRVKTEGLFGVKEREWRRDELAAIRADASGLESNHHPILELQVHPAAGKKAGYLAGHDEAELRWMAARLRQALNVPARGQFDSPDTFRR
jgi:hypothetical protein